jgi:hypothetical protein
VSGTMSYNVVFTRYNIFDGRVISAPVRIQATGMQTAFEKATTILRGMVYADRDNEYEIVSVSCDGYSGPQSNYAFDIFRIDPEVEDDITQEDLDKCKAWDEEVK